MGLVEELVVKTAPLEVWALAKQSNDKAEQHMLFKGMMCGRRGAVSIAQYALR